MFLPWEVDIPPLFHLSQSLVGVSIVVRKLCVRFSFGIPSPALPVGQVEIVGRFPSVLLGFPSIVHLSLLGVLSPVQVCFRILSVVCDALGFLALRIASSDVVAWGFAVASSFDPHVSISRVHPVPFGRLAPALIFSLLLPVLLGGLVPVMIF